MNRLLQAPLLWGLMFGSSCSREMDRQATASPATPSGAGNPASDAPPAIRIAYSHGWGKGYVLELDAVAGVWRYHDRDAGRRDTRPESDAARTVNRFSQALEAVPDPGGLLVLGVADGGEYSITVVDAGKTVQRRFGSPSTSFHLVGDASPVSHADSESAQLQRERNDLRFNELKAHWSAMYLENEIEALRRWAFRHP